MRSSSCYESDSRYTKHYQQLWRYYNHVSGLMPLTNSYLTTILVHMLWHSGELHILAPLALLFIFGTACQIYCYGRYCVTQSVSPKVPESPSGPLVDNFIVLLCVACGVACVKLLPGVDRWKSLDDPRVIGPAIAMCGGGRVIRLISTGFLDAQS